jgi:flagellar basal body-associated protein FliL
MALVVALVLVLAAGSLYALLRPAASGPLFRIGSSGRGGQGGSVPASSLGDGEVGVFSGIGRLRIPTSGQPPATLILSISFPYPAGDRAFTEELASHLGDFRSIATGYFSSLSADAIAGLDEDTAKAEILRGYNALLRLGRIEALYFGDLMIVE